MTYVILWYSIQFVFLCVGWAFSSKGGETKCSDKMTSANGIWQIMLEWCKKPLFWRLGGMLTSSFVGPRDAKRSEWKQWVQSRLHDTIAQLQHAKASDIYKILQPKKMVDKKKGKRGKPLPGLQDADGVWKTSRQEVAMYCMAPSICGHWKCGTCRVQQLVEEFQTQMWGSLCAGIGADSDTLWFGSCHEGHVR